MVSRSLLLGALLLTAVPLSADAGDKPLPLPAGTIARYGSPRMRHPEAVNRIAWLHDQKRVLTRTPNHLFLWEIDTRRCLWQLPVGSGTDWLLDCSSRGLAIVQSDNEVRFLDQDGKIKYTLKHMNRRPWNVVVSANGEKLLVIWDGGPSMIFEITDKGPQQPGRELAKTVVYAPQFTADGNQLIFTSTRDVEIWDMKKFEKIRNYQANDHPVYYHTSRISPDGKTLLAICADSLRVWKATEAKEWAKFERTDWLKASQWSNYYHIGFTEDSSALVIGTAGGKFARWSTETGKLLSSKDMTFNAQKVQLSPDGKRLAVVGNNALAIWDTTTGTMLGSDKGPPMIAARFVTSDRVLSTGEDQSLHWWDPKTGKAIMPSIVRPPPAKWGPMILSPDARWWAAQEKESNIMHTGAVDQDKERDKRTNLTAGVIGTYAFSRDSKELLTADKVGNWEFWDIEKAKQSRSFKAPWPSRLDYDIDNRRVAAYLRDGGAVAVYDAQSGKRRLISEPVHANSDRVDDFLFSPSGQYLAVTHAETLCVLSAIYGRAVLRRPMEPGLRANEGARVQQAALFSPDERWLLVGFGNSSKLHLYDLHAACFPDYTPKTIEAHTGGVISLHISPDRKHIVSTGQDGTSLVWDAQKLFPAAEVPGKLKEFKSPDDWWTALKLSRTDELSRLMVMMIHDPARTVPLLDKQLEPVRGPHREELRKWVSQLDSPQFTQRESAMKILGELGELAEPEIRAALKKAPTLEFRLRAHQLLQKLELPESQPERLQVFRAIEVLERIATKEARAVLTRIAGGAAGARQTVEANEALRRLALRVAGE